MPAKSAVPITMRALLQRINRALKKDGEVLKATRGGASQELGAFYRLDLNRAAVVAKKVDPEELGRTLGVLQAWEKVTE